MLNVVQAREKAAASGIEEDHLQFVSADAESVTFPEESFHLITCSSGMLYIQNHEQALKRMLKWLKPGGKLCFNTPQVMSVFLNLHYTLHQNLACNCCNFEFLRANEEPLSFRNASTGLTLDQTSY